MYLCEIHLPVDFTPFSPISISTTYWAVTCLGQNLSPSNGLLQRFPSGPDCILSKLKLIRLSSFTHTRSVSERLSYPIITDLDSNAADYPILNIITIGYGY